MFQPKFDYFSDLGFIFARIIKSNNSIVVAKLYEEDDCGNYQYYITFMGPHSKLQEILNDCVGEYWLE